MTKLILSRKGFDSTAGGGGSPILPDGRLISLPIPGGGCGRQYDAIEWASGKTLGALMTELGIAKPRFAHHDPDLDEAAFTRAPGWRPMFGQAEAASKHLINQGVGRGDVFLFFGRFRWTSSGVHGLEFAGDGVHVIWGFLEVDEVRDPTTDPEPPKWAVDHPHYACRDERWFTRNNRVYISGRESQVHPRRSGAGIFPVYRDGLRLTAPAPNMTMSRWRLPMAFHPDSGAQMSNTSIREWSSDGAEAFLQAIGQRQEFVIEMSQEIKSWVHDIIIFGRSSPEA